MAKVRDKEATRARIVKAALKEFVEKGYEGTTISRIARRARLSKQLLSHHFPTKERLFQEVHDLRFRDPVGEIPPSSATDLFAQRFRLRAQDVDYVRFLTWEAASVRSSKVPGREARLRRIIDKGSTIRRFQARGEIPPHLDHKLMQLAITSLATYPLAFGQITQLITGRDPIDAQFQEDWYRFLQAIGRMLFEQADNGAPGD
ncbi:MAG: TetR/AcrR family transcriptional regulator [Betaproteobacteria bacterium]|nr:TetR/AcrR family transcriptional regulator [Betaproteobacteria bacterium]